MLFHIYIYIYLYIHICTIHFERGCCPHIHGLSINETIDAQEVDHCNDCLLSPLSRGAGEARIRRNHRGHDMFCIIFGTSSQQKNHQPSSAWVHAYLCLHGVFQISMLFPCRQWKYDEDVEEYFIEDETTVKCKRSDLTRQVESTEMDDMVLVVLHRGMCSYMFSQRMNGYTGRKSICVYIYIYCMHIYIYIYIFQ